MPSTHINSKLPPEVLREIFLEYALTAEPDDIPSSRSDLCLVCRHWRQLVESHARLWSTIYIHCWRRDRRIWPSASAVRLSLKRSVGAPLEIYMVRFGHGEQAAVDLYTAEVFPLLAAQAFRWQRLVLDLDDVLVERVQRIAFAEAEWLQDVVIKGRYHDRDSGETASSGKDLPVVSALASAPNLRSFKWRNASDAITRYIVKAFPLERLTDLDLDLDASMSLPELLHVMRKCTSVAEMKIRMERCIYISQDPLSPVTLPNLRTLQLSLAEAEYYMLKYFSFPNLEFLVLRWHGESMYDVEDDIIIPLSSYLSNSRHCIQVLLVDDYLLPIGKLATFLSDSAVVRIPLVQIHTRSLPGDIRDNILEAVETRLPDTREAEFVITPDDEEWEGFAVMGWTNASTYEKFEDYLTSLDEYVYCDLE